MRMTKRLLLLRSRVGEAKEVSLEKSLVFEHQLASLSDEHDLPPAWA